MLNADPEVEDSQPERDIVDRPKSLDDFNGQSAAKGNLKVFVNSAKIRKAALDHVLFHGPPGVGKTTLAQIIAHELGCGFKQLAAPAIEKPSDIVGVLASLEDNDVLFLDEIHRLPIKIEELLYIAMEDYRLDVVIGDPGQAKAISIPLPRFTLIGATTRPGNLSAPLKSRFGIEVRLELYTREEMVLVIQRAAPKLGIQLSDEAAQVIAERSRGTPRIGLALLNRVRDFSIVSGKALVGVEVARTALDELGIDERGLNDLDRRYLAYLEKAARPVGLKTIAASLQETEDGVEHSIEPYLLHLGLLDRSPRGRQLAGKAKNGQSAFAF